MVTGLAIATPVLALCWAVDGAVAVLSRVAPGIPILDLAPPARILGGGGVLWIGLGLVCDRLLAGASAIPAAWASLAGSGP
jgi:flagellar biosynthesis protein FliR